MLPIHPGRLDFGVLSLVSPEHKPETQVFFIVASHQVKLPSTTETGTLQGNQQIFTEI
jgi:hypothetical protein